MAKIDKKSLNSDDPIESFIFSEAAQAYAMIDKIDFQLEAINKVLHGNGILTSEIVA